LAALAALLALRSDRTRSGFQEPVRNVRRYGVMIDPVSYPTELFVGQLRLHSPLSRQARDAIRALPYRLKAQPAGAYLLREGDHPVVCQVLKSGFAYRQKETRDGKRQIVSIHNPGEALDLQQLALERTDHSLRMLTAGEVAIIERDAIRRLMADDHEVGTAIFKATLIEASIFREWVLNVGRRSARARVAHFLCEFYMRLKAADTSIESDFELPMSQDQLADVTGLERDGLIARERRRIRLLSWSKLKEAGTFDERYLHIGADRWSEENARFS
jgi:CRP-like cAMP-binding protein